MNPKEIADTIFECGLAPHSDITREWMEDEINFCINKKLQEFCDFHNLPNSMIGKFNLNKL